MSSAVALEFEKPVKDLEAKIAELSRLVGEDTDGAMSDELGKLREQAAKRLTQVYRAGRRGSRRSMATPRLALSNTVSPG